MEIGMNPGHGRGTTQIHGWKCDQEEGQCRGTIARANGYTYREQDGLHEEAHVNYTAREIVSRPTAGTSALVHEAAHVLLHEGRYDLTSDQKETEAEATAFLVCQHFTIETKAPNYLAHWSSPEQIKASTHRILTCAEQIINACEQ